MGSCGNKVIAYEFLFNIAPTLFLYSIVLIIYIPATVIYAYRHKNLCKYSLKSIYLAKIATKCCLHNPKRIVLISDVIDDMLENCINDNNNECEALSNIIYDDRLKVTIIFSERKVRGAMHCSFMDTDLIGKL